MGEWLNTQISQITSNGGISTQTEQPVEIGKSGSSDGNMTSTESQTVLAAGSRVTGNEITSPGNQTSFGHYAIKIHMEIPIQNRQAVPEI